MSDESLLAGKPILIVDDEPDVLETLEDLLAMCRITTATNFEDGKALLEQENFAMAILDIMGVYGYDLLQIAQENNVTAVMLTAHAVSPDNVKKSYQEGAAYYVPKEEMINIETILNDILLAQAEGRDTWGNWFDRFSRFCERKFGPQWQQDDQKFWDKFPFH